MIAWAYGRLVRTGTRSKQRALSNQVDTVTLRKGSFAPRAVIALGGVYSS